MARRQAEVRSGKMGWKVVNRKDSLYPICALNMRLLKGDMARVDLEALRRIITMARIFALKPKPVFKMYGDGRGH